MKVEMSIAYDFDVRTPRNNKRRRTRRKTLVFEDLFLIIQALHNSSPLAKALRWVKLIKQWGDYVDGSFRIYGLLVKVPAFGYVLYETVRHFFY